MGTEIPISWTAHHHRLLLTSLFFPLVLLLSCHRQQAEALGCNWGTQSTHPLPGDVVVRLLKDNGFDKVKLFEATPWALHALGRSGIQVMVGIPNEFLAPLASSVRVAEEWVIRNVSTYISKFAVDIRYVAVGNEPFLKTYNGKYEQSTFPALQNVQAAIIKAGLSQRVKVTTPFNADVYQSESGLPSGGDFRSDIHDLMVRMVRFLGDNGGPLTINIYPFLSLYADPHFPLDYAFFGSGAAPVVDGSISYTNVFDANFDTLISALDKNGLSDVQVIVGEIGWPTDGNKNANPDYARRFNQGLINRIMQRTGTPRRPSPPPDVYLFGLLDEDAKSIMPGDFERHWGLFAFDGSLKYPLVLANARALTPAGGISYLPRQWCVMSPSASVIDPLLPASLNYACTYADCTSLGYGSSCGDLDVRSNASYAFNQFYQTMNQQNGACRFGNLSVITTVDPSPAGQPRCRFEVMIDMRRGQRHPPSRGVGAPPSAPSGGWTVKPTMGLVTLMAFMWTWMR